MNNKMLLLHVMHVKEQNNSESTAKLQLWGPEKKHCLGPAMAKN